MGEPFTFCGHAVALEEIFTPEACDRLDAPALVRVARLLETEAAWIHADGTADLHGLHVLLPGSLRVARVKELRLLAKVRA